MWLGTAHTPYFPIRVVDYNGRLLLVRLSVLCVWSVLAVLASCFCLLCRMGRAAVSTYSDPMGRLYKLTVYTDHNVSCSLGRLSSGATIATKATGID